MEQRKRLGRDGGLGYYTSQNKSKKNGCVYCSKPASTREHVPSQTFLIEPIPDNLPTLPACFECNNGFSEDELYVACFLDIFKMYVYGDCSRKVETDRRLAKFEKLCTTIGEQLKVEDGKVYYHVDEERLLRILLKLAKGHAAFEVDYLSFDDTDTDFAYDFIFNLDEETVADFEAIEVSEKYPEIGSRGMLIFQNVDTGDAVTIAQWNEVQENQYRYQVSQNDKGETVVKLVIFEFLYCKVTFK